MSSGRVRRLLRTGRGHGRGRGHHPPDDIDPDGVVRAAGGLVWRRSSDGDLLIAVVHRPRYDDWSFPKGKLHRGETFKTAAVREVEEETGLRCKPKRELPATNYTDRYGRPKMVRYFSMQAPERRKRFHRNAEVDRLRWLRVHEAAQLLSYEHDRRLLDEMADADA